VRIETSTFTRRSTATRNGFLGAAFALASTAALIAMNVFAPVAVGFGALVAFGALTLARRAYRRDAAAAQLAIEQALDRVEFGEPKKRTLLDQLLLPEK
jgi:hypothetical protein